MEQQLRAFIEAHPGGWGHEDWVALLDELERHGVDVSDSDSLGLKLENERLAWELDRLDVSGLGPRRTAAIVERFGTWWRVRHTNAEELSEIKTISLALARRVVDAVQKAAG